MKTRVLSLARIAVAVILFAFSGQLAQVQANGKLQIHFMDVGQGDGALLISPLGETVLFDDGALNFCDKPVSYLQQLGVTKIDYHD
jgi:competence protein ComEC